MNKLEMQALLVAGVLPEQLQKAATWIELYQVEERVQRRVACRVEMAMETENPFVGLEQQQRGKRVVKVAYQGPEIAMD